MHDLLRDADPSSQSNTTSVMPGPSDKSSSVFAASRTGLVQLTTGGDLYGMPFSPDDDGANAQATWTKITTPKLNFGPSNLQQSAPSDSGTHGTGSSTASSARASDAASDGRARRTTMLLNGGMTVAGLALGAIGFALSM